MACVQLFSFALHSFAAGGVRPRINAACIVNESLDIGLFNPTTTLLSKRDVFIEWLNLCECHRMSIGPICRENAHVVFALSPTRAETCLRLRSGTPRISSSIAACSSALCKYPSPNVTVAERNQSYSKLDLDGNLEKYWQSM